MNKRILKLAIPAIATNITIPLLSLVDISIAGHIGNVSNICAVSVGSAILNILYWNFGFLRMGTSGLTAQSLGKRDLKESIQILGRSLFVALCASILIYILKTFIQQIAFYYMHTSADTERLATLDLNICIIGAPAVLCMYSIKGWFIGMQNTIFPMIVAISINIINIICSILFVIYLNMDLKGIALGTVIAQYCGLLLAVSLFLFKYKKLRKYIIFKDTFNKEKILQFFKINSAIAIRTICLTAVTSFFTFAGAKQGDTLLAVNTVLMQMFTIFSYFTDGFAYAGEALSGKYVGAKDFNNLRESVKYIFYWGFFITAIFTILYLLFTENIISLLTNQRDVIELSRDYKIWVTLIPICGFAAFLWDGIMVGATLVKEMVLTMLIATASFFLLYNLFINSLGNDALWIASLTYLSARGFVQTIIFNYKLKGIIQ